MSIHRQQGLSSIAILVIILVVVFFATCAAKVGPVYMESFTVKRAVENVVDQFKGKAVDPGQIKDKLSRQFQVNRVEALNFRDIKVTREKGKVTLDATYEKRVHLMFNIDVVVKFDTLIYEI